MENSWQKLSRFCVTNSVQLYSVEVFSLTLAKFPHQCIFKIQAQKLSTLFFKALYVVSCSSRNDKSFLILRSFSFIIFCSQVSVSQDLLHITQSQKVDRRH